MVKIIKAPSAFMIDAWAQFLKETGKKEVRFNEFMEWMICKEKRR